MYRWNIIEKTTILSYIYTILTFYKLILLPIVNIAYIIVNYD